MDYTNLEMLTWLVGQFRKAGKDGITFDELIDNLFNEPNMDKNLPKRTFHNYLKELRERFGIKIECDKRLQYDVARKGLSEENKRYRYRLVEEPKSDNTPWTMPFLWSLETSAAMKQLHDSEEYKKYVYIDCKASGAENVNILLDAIRQQRCVDLYYNDPIINYTYLNNMFEPRGLVLKDFVWYLLGHTKHHMETVWPLYRLSKITITDIQYRPEYGFTPEKFWKANKKNWIDSIQH